MPSASQMIAVLAIAAYLSAAFLPCDRDGEKFLSAASPVETHSMSIATGMTPQSPHPQHHGGHGERAHRANSAHAADHGAQESPDAIQPHARFAMGSSLVWLPTCLCGCGDSRATVGGGAARLGPLVLTALDAPWPIEAARLARGPVPQLIPAPAKLIDPIPT